MGFIVIGEYVGRVIAIIFHFLVIIVPETRPERQVLVDALLATLKRKIRVMQIWYNAGGHAALSGVRRWALLKASSPLTSLQMQQVISWV